MARRGPDAGEDFRSILDPMTAAEASYLYQMKQKASDLFLFLKSRENLVCEGDDLGLQLCPSGCCCLTTSDLAPLQRYSKEESADSLRCCLHDLSALVVKYTKSRDIWKKAEEGVIRSWEGSMLRTAEP